MANKIAKTGPEAWSKISSWYYRKINNSVTKQEKEEYQKEFGLICQFVLYNGNVFETTQYTALIIAKWLIDRNYDLFMLFAQYYILDKKQFKEDGTHDLDALFSG